MYPARPFKWLWAQVFIFSGPFGGRGWCMEQQQATFEEASKGTAVPLAQICSIGKEIPGVAVSDLKVLTSLRFQNYLFKPVWTITTRWHHIAANWDKLELYNFATLSLWL